MATSVAMSSAAYSNTQAVLGAPRGKSIVDASSSRTQPEQGELERARRKRPLMQFRTTDAQGMVNVLIGAGSVSIK